MIIDHEHDACPQEWIADICVIGAGAVGLLLAEEFKDSGKKVIILESGGWQFDQKTQDLYETVQTGKSFESAHTGRFRVLGGSTTRWGGQSLPLMPIDFEERPWIKNSGWPIKYDEISPFFDRANQFLHVDTLDYKHQTAGLLKMSMPAFDEQKLEFHFSKWAPESNLIKVYKKKLTESDSVQVILHANVTELISNQGCVSSAVYKSLSGKRGTVNASTFIVATGGVEVPRVLLASRNDNGLGLGNEHDMVGRFLQEHPATRLGWIETKSPDYLQKLFNGRRAGGRKYSSRLSLSASAQEKNQMLNAGAAFVFTLPKESGFQLVKSFIKGNGSRLNNQGYAEILGGIIKSVPDLFKAAWCLIVEGRVHSPGSTCEVLCSIEQEASYESRVTLSSDCDRLGMPKSCVHWVLSKKILHTARVFADIIDSELQRLGIGRLVKNEWLTKHDDELIFEDYFHDQNHHMGTARMSDRADDGVVDRNLKVHSVKNLYIASSAVFPTGGHSNPTLTLLAFSVRLADHLKKLGSESNG